TLFVIHNMGAGCAYCTLWADGFNGVYEHLRNRAGFVVSSPDAPAQQQAFAASRGWKFPMISYQGNRFGEDMGYRVHGGAQPGVSVFRRKAGKILRVADTGFQPGDDFCSVWHLFDLIPEGAAGWQPKFAYVGGVSGGGAHPSLSRAPALHRPGWGFHVFPSPPHRF